MNIDEFEHALETMNPTPVIDRKQFGTCTWIHIYFQEKAFAAQYVPGEEIGVSELDLSIGSDFSGHDEEYQEFESVLEFIKENLAQ